MFQKISVSCKNKKDEKVSVRVKDANGVHKMRNPVIRNGC